MGSAASTRRRATLNTFTLRTSPGRNDLGPSLVDNSIDKEAPRANSAPPPPKSEVGIPRAGAIVPDGESLPEQTATGAPGGKDLEGPAAAGGAPIQTGLAAVGGKTQLRVYDDGLDSMPSTGLRRNEFHTLQDEMHQKRAVGMSYNDIFNEMSAQAKGAAAKPSDQTLKHSRRATVEERGRDQRRPSVDKAPPPVGGVFRRLTGRGRERYDDEGDGDNSLRDSKDDTKRPPSPLSEGGRQLLRPIEDKWGEQAAGTTACPTPVGDALPSGGDGADDVSMSSYNSRGPNALSNKPLRRARIFDKGIDATTMQGMLDDDAESDEGAAGAANVRSVLSQKRALMGEQTADIVIGALQKFFFLDSGSEEKSEEAREGDSGSSGEVTRGMAMLMRAMEREEHGAGTSLMEQGEEGQYMFVVEEGSLEVIIDGEAIRVIGVGDRVGELALLYNAPRSASVRTLSPCVLWSIHREEFKAVQALTASGNLIARSTHLYHVPWLRLLGTTDLSKLAACCRMAQYRDGDTILKEGEETDRCFLIESGEVVCSTKEDIARDQAEDKGDGIDGVENGDVCERVERLMMVARPGRRSNTPSPTTGNPDAIRGAPGTPPRPAMQTSGLGGGGGGVGVGVGRHSSDGNLAGTTGRPGLTSLSRTQGRLNMGGVNGMGASRSECQPHWDEARGQVSFGKGCFLGVPVLLASAELEIDGLPGWDLAPSCPRQGDDDAEAAADGASSLAFAACSPVQIVAKGDVRIGHFDVARFAKTVGAFAKVLGKVGEGGGTSALRNVRCRQSQSRHSLLASPGGGLAFKYEKLSAQSFERMDFLGQGSFGHVTMVRKKEGVMGGALFALKSLSKDAVVEGGQVHHLKDEKNVLEMFNHPFILRLYTTFQDNNRVFFLTELLTGGELWSVIYESASGFASGLPPEHVTFYSAVVVDALAYMHKKGIAYRDLKPENLIVDDTGYLRIIDMGFAKQIPFFVSVGGGTQMHPRSHTMCGTPEYLAPEFIFNKGHDQSADLWALGVLIFELVEARTPFAPVGAEQDIAQLFTNIACVKKRGVEFPDTFDEKSGGPHCRSLISGMLEFEPGDRLGNLANGMNDVKEHAMYAEMDWEALESKVVVAPWTPEGPAPHPDPDSIDSSNDVYRGDQAPFADF